MGSRAAGYAFLAAAAFGSAAGPPVLPAPPMDRPPARWHFVFRKGLELSILFWRGEAGDDTRLLLLAEGRRYIFGSRQDLTGRDSTEAIGLLTPGGVPEVFERRLVLSGLGAVPGCEGVKPPDACVLFAGPKGRAGSGLSAYSGESAAAARERAAALLSPGLREALFDLAGVLPLVTEFGSYTDDFLGLVWPERFRRPQRLERGKREGGCSFDTAFGYPCDAAEREKERKRFGGPP